MHVLNLLLIVGCLLLLGFAKASAETGPCRPDAHGGLTCGQGAGAARVVDDTMSPSKRLAFAWRSPAGPPTENPDGGDVEILLIRLSDGAVLWKAPGEYWNTGEMRANRYDEAALWSPNSRFAVETLDFRWSTENLRVFAIGDGDKASVLDLKAIMEPAVRKQLRRAVKNEPSYAFQIFGNVNGEAPRLTIDDRGLVKALVLMTIPKQEPYAMFAVTFQVSQRNGALGAREVSVSRSRVKPW